MHGLTYDIGTTAEVLAETPTAMQAEMIVFRRPQDRVNGIAQMLIDLKSLAENDGCVAAGWAYEYLMLLALGRCDLKVFK